MCQSKATQAPFPHNTIHNTQKFELVDVDIWGPYHTPTCNKYKYFITLVDDFTKTTLTHLLTGKSNAFTVVQHFIVTVKNQFNNHVQIIRTDNALELG